MSKNPCPGYDPTISRRDLLWSFGTGLGGIALGALLSKDAEAGPNHRSIGPHYRPRAQNVIQIFLQGGLSQVDSFDYKPELAAYHSKSMPAGKHPDAFFGKIGLLHGPHWPFRQRGSSGLWISDLFPHIAEMADELTRIRSMWAGTGNHTPATYEANSGFRTLGFPSTGAWISYGLGSDT